LTLFLTGIRIALVPKRNIMKSVLITAVVVGAAIATLLYLTEETRRTPLSDAEDAADDVEDAAKSAYRTMNKHIGKVERSTERALNGKF
jgi:hypothetical protein